MVGPFIFFDQMGPAEFLTGEGVDVRPHPHIGLAHGHLSLSRRAPPPRQRRHRPDHPAGRRELDGGGARRHPFRAHHRTRAAGPSSLFGIQTWVALPEAHEDMAPISSSCEGRAASARERRHVVRLILGTAYGAKAPAKLFSETFYADVVLSPGARLPLPDDHEDRGIYIIEGEISVAGHVSRPGR